MKIREDFLTAVPRGTKISTFSGALLCCAEVTNPEWCGRQELSDVKLEPGLIFYIVHAHAHTRTHPSTITD